MEYLIVSLTSNIYLCEKVSTGEREPIGSRQFKNGLPVVGNRYVFEVRANAVKIYPIVDTSKEEAILQDNLELRATLGILQ